MSVWMGTTNPAYLGGKPLTLGQMHIPFKVTTDSGGY